MKGICTKLLCDNSPESQNRVVHSAISARFRTGRLRNNQIKPLQKGGDKNAVAILTDVRQLGCVFQDTEPLKSFTNLWKGPKILGPNSTSTIHKSNAASRRHQRKQTTFAPGNTSQSSSSSQSDAMKFEDRSYEEIERQERCACGDAWRLARNILKLKEKDKSTFFSPADEWSLLDPSPIKPEGIEFVVDSGASMHMLSRNDLNSAELETVRASKNPTTVVTANGEAQTKEEATVHVKDLDLFVTVKLLEDTPAVLSLGTL